MSVYGITDLTQKLSGGTKDGHSLLQDWDILVTYDEATLNKLLALQGAAVLALQNVPEFQVTDTSGWGSDVYDYTLTLSNPTLRFLEDNTKGDLIQIVFTLGGTISLNDHARPVPDGITMIVTAPLVSAEGHIKNGTLQGDASTVQSSSAIATTPVGKQSMVWICLQQDSLESITFAASNPNAQSYLGNGTVLAPAISNLAAHLDGAASLSFYLSGVQGPSTPQANSDSLQQFQPVCFMFALTPASSPNTGGALCMYICVEGGVTSPGNTGGQQTRLGLVDPTTLAPIYPIPAGKNAAIYFNHALIMNSVFLPGLTQAGLTNIQQLPFDEKKGTHLSFKWPSNAGTLNQGANVPLSDPMDPNAVQIDSIKYDPKDFQSDIYIKPGISTNSPSDTPLMTVSSVSPTYTANWKAEFFSWRGRDRIETDYKGAVNVTMSFGGQGVWQQDLTTTTPKISTTFQPTYTMTQAPASGDSSKWSWLTGTYWSNKLPPAYNTVAPNVPTINLSFPQFGYFLATNLLLPGSNIFTPDAAITDATNQTGGVAIPWDMIITGTIKDHLSDSAAALAAKLCNGSQLPSQPPTISSSLEDKFLSQVSAYDNSNTLVTDLWNSISGDDVDAINNQLNQVLKTRGYQNLDVDNLSTLVGYSYDSDLAFMLADNGGSSANALEMNIEENPVYMFDPGVYSGVYSIDGQPDTVQLLLSPDTHAITYAGTTVVPTITSDNNGQNPQYTVSWSSGSAENKDLVHYAVKFQAVQVAKSSNFQQSFAGTQTPDGSSKPTSFSGTKLASTPPFDLRMCGGTYVVSAPTDLKNESLYVDRANGSIQWEGDTFQPNLTLDATAGATNISWAADGIAYTISFYNPTGKQYFSGYRTSNGQKSAFKGELKQDGSDPGIKDSISGWDALSNSASTIDVILSTVTVGTIIFAVVKFFQREKRKEKENAKQQEHDNTLVAKTVQVINERKAVVHQAIETQLADQLTQNNDSWKKMDDVAFNDGTRAIIQERLDQYYKDHPDMLNDIANADGVQDPNSPFWKDVHDALKEYVTGKVRLYGDQHMDPVNGAWKTLLGAEGYIPGEITKLTENTLKPRVDQIVVKLIGGGFADADTWARARANEVAMNRVKAAYTDIYAAANAKVQQLDTIITTYPGIIEGDQSRIKVIDVELKDSKTTEDRKKELELEKSGLEDEIKKKQPIYDQATGDIIPARKDQSDAEKVKDDAEKNEPVERGKGDRAGQKAFDL
ncbi:hypothetical protein TWF696_000903 [Orbilia brochopaga]|uniref:Uncharacterized protein n=1 Tax=Orbilia brochopaga TaxID=3140254 RepID=A0AAV9VF11_9PEZI